MAHAIEPPMLLQLPLLKEILSFSPPSGSVNDVAYVL